MDREQIEGWSHALDLRDNEIEGQPVIVTLDAIPGVTLNGNVLVIGKNYSENQGDVIYLHTMTCGLIK
jgi:hypothetical protein